LSLIGGTSWESSAVYYRLLNEDVKQRLGGLHSAHILMVSLDGNDVAEFMVHDQGTRSAAAWPTRPDRSRPGVRTWSCSAPTRRTNVLRPWRRRLACP
jgi:hypothetical protein